jgi:hypothetical protein
VVEYHAEYFPAIQKLLRYAAVIVVIAALVAATLWVAGVFQGMGNRQSLEYGCTNAVGWLLDPNGRHQYEQHALELYQEAERNNDSFDFDLFGDLVSWYMSGNEQAVRAFVDVNSCMDKVSDGAP